MTTISKDNKTLFFTDFQKFHSSLFEDRFNKAPFSVKGKFLATKDVNLEYSGKLVNDQFESSLKWTEEHPLNDSLKVLAEGTFKHNGNCEVESKLLFPNEGVDVGLNLKISGSPDKEFLGEEAEEKEFRDSIGAKVTIQKPKLSGSVEITQKKKNPLDLRASGAVEVYDKLLVGGLVSMKPDTMKVKSYDVGLRYQMADSLTMFAVSEASLRKTRLGLQHKASNDLLVGAELNRTLNCKDKEVPNDIAVAFAYKFSPVTTFKAYLSTATKDLKVSMISNITPHLKGTATINSSISTLNTQGGVKLSFEFDPK
jgi:hypothetical protein